MIGLGACHRGATTDAPVTDAAPGVAPLDASRPPPVPSASVVLAADAGRPPLLPELEKLETKKCPAPIARVDIDKGGPDFARVELVGCPEGEGGGPAVPGAGKSRLTISSAKGFHSVELAEGDSHTEKLEVQDLYGTGRPVFLVTVTQPSMGSWQGPTTTLYEIEASRLVPLSTSVKDGGLEPISLVSAIHVTWWLHEARSKKGKDIYEIRTNAEGKSMGYRYAFEKNKWVVHSGPLKKWTGEHLPDTEAEFR